MDVEWFDGLRDLLPQLEREIRQELLRDPDLGDLLLMVACAQRTLAGEALREIGVDDMPPVIFTTALTRLQRKLLRLLKISGAYGD